MSKDSRKVPVKFYETFVTPFGVMRIIDRSDDFKNNISQIFRKSFEVEFTPYLSRLMGLGINNNLL